MPTCTAPGPVPIGRLSRVDQSTSGGGVTLTQTLFSGLGDQLARGDANVRPPSEIPNDSHHPNESKSADRYEMSAQPRLNAIDLPI
jgi:hypothetical protein